MYILLESISMIGYLESIITAVGWSMVSLILIVCIDYLYNLKEYNG